MRIKENEIRISELKHLYSILREMLFILPNITDLDIKLILNDIMNKVKEVKDEIDRLEWKHV